MISKRKTIIKNHKHQAVFETWLSNSQKEATKKTITLTFEGFQEESMGPETRPSLRHQMRV